MTRRLGFVILCAVFTLLGVGCATKRFVEDQLSASETRVTQLLNATETSLTHRAEAQEATLRETAGSAASSREAIDKVSALASNAKTEADSAAVVASDAKNAARDAEARLTQRLADRNKYRLWETRVYFDSDRAEIRSADITALDHLANALKTDTNATVELQGFADPRGSDRYNNELARERVEAVIRYLVTRHGIELRQIRAVTMGKATPATDDKPRPEAFAEARRVDIRLLTPWSSWEDTQAQIDQSEAVGAASPPSEGTRGTAWREIMNAIRETNGGD